MSPSPYSRHSGTQRPAHLTWAWRLKWLLCGWQALADRRHVRHVRNKHPSACRTTPAPGLARSVKSTCGSSSDVCFALLQARHQSASGKTRISILQHAPTSEGGQALASQSSSTMTSSKSLLVCRARLLPTPPAPHSTCASIPGIETESWQAACSLGSR